MVDKDIYILTIIIGTAIFVLGFYVGGLINQPKINEIKEQNELLTLDIENINLGLKLFEATGNADLSCKYIKNEMSYIESKRMKLVRELEKTERIDQDKFIFTKRKYTLSLANIWILSKEKDKFCGTKSPIILYFYSINSEKCREQGKVLDHIVYEYNKVGKDVTVLSFDKDFDEPIIRALTESFNITESPSLVIGNEEFKSFTSENDIKNALCKEYQLCLS